MQRKPPQNNGNTEQNEKQLIYRINILCTNSFVASMEINKQSLPSPEEIFTPIESCHGTLAAPVQLHSKI